MSYGADPGGLDLEAGLARRAERSLRERLAEAVTVLTHECHDLSCSVLECQASRRMARHVCHGCDQAVGFQRLYVHRGDARVHVECVPLFLARVLGWDAASLAVAA